MTDSNSNPTWKRLNLLKSIVAVGVAGPFVDPAAAQKHPENAIDYEALSPEAKQIFERSLKGEADEEFAYVEFPDQLLEYDFVSYEGGTYDLRRTYRNEARYKVTPEKIDREQLTNHDEQDLVDASQLSPAAENVFRAARSNGVYRANCDFPAQFKFRYQYVSAGGDLFDLNFNHADEPFFSISPKKLD